MNSINSNFNAYSDANFTFDTAKKDSQSSVKLSVKSTQSTDSTTNSQNKFLVTDKSEAVSTSLGYGVDKDGYFTSDFNEAAGIPNDYKIHSSTMESFAKIQEHKQRSTRFISVDVAKAVGNAYKILSQVVGEDILNSQNSFSKDDIAKFPKGYEFDKDTFEVFKIYKAEDELLRVARGYDTSISNKKALLDLFQPQPEMRSILDNLNGGKEDELGGVFWATTADKYTNADRSISKGGLLIGIMNYNTEIAKNATKTERIEDNSPYIVGRIGENSSIKNTNDTSSKEYKNPFDLIFEQISKANKEFINKIVKIKLTKVDIKA